MPPSWSLRRLPIARAALICVLLAASILPAWSCKSEPAAAPGGAHPADAGAVKDAAITADAGVTPDAAITADAEVTPDAMVAPPKTCPDTEVCAFDCGDDAACRQRCPAMLPAAEKTLFDAVMACRRMACTNPEDVTCRCEAECYQDGACAETLDACMAGIADPWCDKFCH